MNEQKTEIIYNALIEAQEYLYDNLDVICDEDYKIETQRVLNIIENAINIIERT